MGATIESRQARSHLLVSNYLPYQGQEPLLLWNCMVPAPKAHMLRGEWSFCVTVSEGVQSDLQTNVRKSLPWYLPAQVLQSPLLLLQVFVMAETPRQALPTSVPSGINCRMEAHCGIDKRDLEK